LNITSLIIKDNPYTLDQGRRYYDCNENLISSVSTILKMFLYKKYDFIYTSDIAENETEAMMSFIDFAIIDNGMKTLNNMWRFSEFSIKKTDKDIIIEEKGEFAKSLRISQTNFLDIRNNSMNRHVLEYRLNQDNYDYEKVQTKIIKKFINEYFYTDDLEQEYENIRIVDWINSYRAIIKTAEKNLQHNVVIKSKNEWKQLLLEFNVRDDSIDTIIDEMIFTTNSSDLLDCPFVKFDNNLAISTYIVAVIDPTRSLLSLMSNNHKKNTKINQKGTNFETYLSKVLNDVNIKSISIKENSYQLDNIFNIGEYLFIIEAKTLNQPTDYFEYARYLDEISDYLEKFKRNYHFFCSDSKIKKIKKELAMTNINTIYKIFVSNVLDTRSKIGDIHLTNDTVFQGYFLQNEPSAHIIEENKMITFPMFNTDAYKGAFNTKKFIKLIEDNLFSKKNEHRIIIEEAILPYSYVEANKKWQIRILNYGFKKIDDKDIIPI